MPPRIRSDPTSLYTRFPAKRRTPAPQILQATWIYLLSVVVALLFILFLAYTTNNRETKSNLWVFCAPWLLSFGGIILKIGLEAVISVALYQRLWYGMCVRDPQPRGRTDTINTTRTDTGLDHEEKGRTMTATTLGGEQEKKQGVSLRELDSRHQASRLSVGMFLSPSWSAIWILGCVGLIITVGAVPALQAALETVQKTLVIETKAEMFHAQLDERLAMPTTSDARERIAPMPYTKRGGALAMFGEDNAYQYTLSNVTGDTRFGPIGFVDIDCQIRAIKGKMEVGSTEDYYYNFTANWASRSVVETDVPRSNSSTGKYVSEMERLMNLTTSRKVSGAMFAYPVLSVEAWLNNNTHFLHHTCRVQPAIGSCSTRLVQGAAPMKALSCTRQRFVYADPVTTTASSSSGNNSIQPVEAGFLATASTFISLFSGAAWSSAEGIAMENSTFTQASIRYATLEEITLPTDLLSHMQRVLWHIPITSQPINIPASQRRASIIINNSNNSTFDAGTGGNPTQALHSVFIPLTVRAESQQLFVAWDYRVLSSVLVLTVLVVAIVIAWLLLAENPVLGRLMRDSVVHMMTVGGRGGGAVMGAEMAGLEDVLKVAGQERVVFGVLDQAWEGVDKEGVGSMGIVDAGEGGRKVGLPVEGRWYGGGVEEWEVEETRRRLRERPGCGLGIQCTCVV